jgi:uncharacterized protein YegL
MNMIPTNTDTAKQTTEEQTSLMTLEKTFLKEVNGKEVLLVYLVDTSASMAANNNIGHLCEGMHTLKSELIADETARHTVKIALVAYGNDTVQIISDHAVTPDEFTPPQLVASGNTPMGQAYMVALELIKTWKKSCSDRKVDYYRPWLVNSTDGIPTDDWSEAARALKDAEEKKGVVSWIMATQGADIDLLKQLSPYRPVLYLRDLDYKSMFLWLSASLGIVSSSDEKGKRPLQKPDGWTSRNY